jgi:hypothetical protein
MPQPDAELRDVARAALADLSPADRATMLACAVLEADNGDALRPILSLIALAKVMTRRLPPVERAAVVCCLLGCAEDLNDVSRWQ